jgi:hypothetical protein
MIMTKKEPTMRIVTFLIVMAIGFIVLEHKKQR